MMTDKDIVNLPNGIQVPYAVYTKQEVSDFKGNPLIEALPPILSFEESYEKLSYLPEYRPEERNLSVHHRYHALLRITRIYQPTNKTIELELKFSRFLRYGYVNRNPDSKQHTMVLNELKDRLINKYDLGLSNDIRTTSSSFTLMGFSGIGKTSAIERVLSLYPQVIVHKYPLNLFQITFLKLNSPHDGSIKTLCMDFFLKIDQLLGTNYFEKYGNRRFSNSSMVVRMGQVARIHCLGALIIDEIQHLLANKKSESDELMNFFVTMVNEIGVPIMLIGTMKAKSILQKDFRQARRSSGHGDMVWEQMKNDDSWQVLISCMWEYQWTKKEAKLTDDWINFLYKESQGITDIALKLYFLAQSYVIECGIEELSFDVVRHVKKEYLKLVIPFLKALESGKVSEIVKYEDITPLNLEEFLTSRISRVNMQHQIQIEKEKQADNRKKKEISLLEKLIVTLISLDIEAELAEKLARDVVKENPTVDIKHGMFLVMKKMDDWENAKDKKELEEKKNKQSNKLLSIVEKGRENQLTAREALIEAGFINSITKELLL
ncbi:AAA domain-containing protein [Amphibacillus marinus]|uniref:AAA domain-containing protein n=1 Tax=Amphibacillus marinus TaxID=872970 RepID=A0A1H8TIB9_9BACI|nr:ATP-binding protein [Amphibacillus marinus]SEO90551.1 AAA domain-containing protein [Amphibacillus marinus]